MVAAAVTALCVPELESGDIDRLMLGSMAVRNQRDFRGADGVMRPGSSILGTGRVGPHYSQ
jgi:hypothetical protein